VEGDGGGSQLVLAAQVESCNTLDEAASV